MCAHNFQLVSELCDFPCSFDFVKLTNLSSSFRLLRIGSFRGNFSVVLDLPPPLALRSTRHVLHGLGLSRDCFASVPSEETSPWFWTCPLPSPWDLLSRSPQIGTFPWSVYFGAELNYVLFLSQALSVCVFYFVFIPL